MSAIIGECGQYRYLLTRPGDCLADKGTAVFLMLNPSTADAALDDPTIRRCRNFASAWGCNGIAVVNLYALRATNPADLWKHDDPVGPDNDWRLRAIARVHRHRVRLGRQCEARASRSRNQHPDRRRRRLWCLGTTKDGHPRHPLYVPGNQALQPWAPRVTP
ncbi:DUF1643 domain-containing protein [Pseudomonas aeruginosa]|nr:DUF1643 domain-containing protein [Pseudomonas aeruginosa]